MSKPRASGDDPVAASLDTIAMHVNPARAGMIRPSDLGPGEDPGKPRASGDDPAMARASVIGIS